MRMPLVGVSHSTWQGSGDGAAPKPHSSRPLPLCQCPLSPLRGAVEGLPWAPTHPEAVECQGSHWEPSTGPLMLSHFPGAAVLGDTGWLRALKASPAGWYQDLQPPNHCSMDPLARLGPRVSPPLPQPTSSLASSAPPPPRSVQGPWGCCLISGGCCCCQAVLGWLDTRRRNPSGEPEQVPGRPHPCSEAAVRLRARQVAGLSSALPAPLFSPGCAHTPAGMTAIPVAVSFPLGDSNIPEGGKDRVLFSLISPGCPAKSWASTGHLGPVAEWPRIKSRITLAAPRCSCAWQAAP